ncbi:MAG: hypothetical protein ACI9BO_002193 [Zhongshania sp.]|jgi:hypothetical protein
MPTTTLARLMGLPRDAPLIYRAMAGDAVPLFGFAYAWLSMQAVIDRPMVVSTTGKLSASVAGLAAYDDLPARSVIMTSPDFLFAAIFIWWLQDAQQGAPADPPGDG